MIYDTTSVESEEHYQWNSDDTSDFWLSMSKAKITSFRATTKCKETAVGRRGARPQIKSIDIDIDISDQSNAALTIQ